MNTVPHIRQRPQVDKVAVLVVIGLSVAIVAFWFGIYHMVGGWL